MTTFAHPAPSPFLQPLRHSPDEDAAANHRARDATATASKLRLPNNLERLLEQRPALEPASAS
jgi:hypothetical protein